jgi:hypothetical protein
MANTSDGDSRSIETPTQYRVCVVSGPYRETAFDDCSYFDRRIEVIF